MTNTVTFPTYCGHVGFGLLLGGVCGLLPTPVGAPVAVGLGVVCLCLARWLR